MRVIAGSAGGLRLQYPRGADIRPTTDRVRESLFAGLGDEVTDQRFCDLYAGAGSVGIEALSRGAASAVFVDSDRRCIEALDRNLRHTHLADRATVIRANLPGCIERVWQNSGPFDIVFADPPYSVDAAPLMRMAAQLAAGREVLLILQCDCRAAAEVGGWRQVRRQEFGETCLLWYRHTTVGLEEKP